MIFLTTMAIIQLQIISSLPTATAQRISIALTAMLIRTIITMIARTIAISTITKTTTSIIMSIKIPKTIKKSILW